jgi:glucose-fructose oxidoreductase
MVVETSRGPLNFTPPNQQAVQMDDFANCILTNRQSIVGGELGRRDMVIIDATYKAAATGKRVEVKV